MAEYTENYNLKKPTQNEFYDVDDFNGNADLIDAAMKDLEDKKVDASGGEAGESVVSFTDSADPEVTSFATLISSIVSEMSLSKFLRVLKTGLSYIAPKSHAAANKDYGGATATNYGHVKLSDVYSAADPAGSAADSLGASQNALYNAYNTLNSKMPIGLRTVVSGKFKATSTNWEYTGISVTVPANHTYLLQGGASYNTAKPIGMALSLSDSRLQAIGITYLDDTVNTLNYVSQSSLCAASNTTVYLWERRKTVPTADNNVYIQYVDITN